MPSSSGTKRHYISESSSSFDHYFSPPKKAKQSPLVWSESEESLVSESNYDMLKDLKDAIGLEGDVEEEEILIAAEPFMIFLDINHEEHDDIIQLLHQNEQPE